jgi:hypothetical protein
MVVKRKTRNEGNTRRNPTVPRVQPLLKCGPSFATNPRWMSAQRPHTERCLQLNGSHHDRTTLLAKVLEALQARVVMNPEPVARRAPHEARACAQQRRSIGFLSDLRHGATGVQPVAGSPRCGGVPTRVLVGGDDMMGRMRRRIAL